MKHIGKDDQPERKVRVEIHIVGPDGEAREFSFNGDDFDFDFDFEDLEGLKHLGQLHELKELKGLKKLHEHLLRGNELCKDKDLEAGISFVSLQIADEIEQSLSLDI